MPVKDWDLPPAVARRFTEDMRAYFAEPDEHKRDAIAVRQLSVLNDHKPPRAKRLWLADVKELFRQMKGEL